MSRSRDKRILLSSGVGLVQRCAQLLTALVTLPLVIHTLGVSGFGVWGAATSLAWLSGLLDLGFGSALVTLVPQALVGRRAGAAGAHVAAALLAGSAIALVLLAIGGTALAFGGLHVQGAFVIAGAALALNIPLGIAGPTWLGLQKGYVGGFWELFQTLLTLALLLVGAAVGLRVAGMVGVVYLATLITNGASLAHLLVTQPAVRPAAMATWASVREVFSRGGLMFAISVAGASAYVLDNVMALAWLGPQASAQMTVILRVCTTATGMLMVISQPIWPAFADAAALGDRRWMWRTLRLGSLGLAVLAVLGSSVLVAVGAPVLRWWLHQDLNLDQRLIWAMAAWIVVTPLIYLPGLFLNSMLRLRPQLLILAATGVAGFALKNIAARHFGLAGMLLVYPALVLVVIWPAYLWLSWRTLSGVTDQVAIRPAAEPA